MKNEAQHLAEHLQTLTDALSLLNAEYTADQMPSDYDGDWDTYVHRHHDEARALLKRLKSRFPLTLNDAAIARMHEDPNEWIFENEEGTVDSLAHWLHVNTGPDVSPFSVGEIFKLCTLFVGERMPTDTGYLKRVA